MSEFIEANLPHLINQGVPSDLAQQAIEILDAQNNGELPCPLEGEDLAIVQQAWSYMTEVA